MDKLIAGFSSQLKKAIEIAESYDFKLKKDIKIDNVLVVGLGGSGIGGTIIQNFSSNQSNIPVFVTKDYNLPKFVSDKTLIIACSYSGNTEETVYSLKSAIQLGAQIITVTSGGQVGEMAKEHNLDCILVPGGFPPRSCLGYMLVQLLNIFRYFSLISDYQQDLNNSIALIDAEETAIKVQGKDIAAAIHDKMPIIYIQNNLEGIAIRWRQQFNENGKMLACHHVIPEMNHNEIVGWRDNDDSRAVFFLRTNTDFQRSQMRMDLNKETIGQYTKNVFEIWAKGNSNLEHIIYLVHLGDWISWYLAQERNFDATEVHVIDALKSALNN